MAVKICGRCNKKAHYLRGFESGEYHTAPEEKFCSNCYEVVSIELCIEVDETMMRYARG